MITKKQAIKLLTEGEPDADTNAAAARVVGISEAAVGNWQTDDRGRLTQVPVINLITATLMRRQIIRLAKGEIDGTEDGPSVEVLLDLATLPPSDSVMRSN